MKEESKGNGTGSNNINKTGHSKITKENSNIRLVQSAQRQLKSKRNKTILE